jgi:PAS domain S-box-containing protein
MQAQAPKDLTEALREAALAVSTAEGERALEDLVSALARILGVDYALISVYVEPERKLLRTLASFFGGRVAKNIEYPVAGTPCEFAIGRAFGYYPSGVARTFPQYRTLVEQRIEGYAATTLHDVSGTPIGALTVMSRAALGDAELTEAMLKIFAARIGAEIERRRSAQSYRAIFDSAESAIFVLDFDNGAIVDANPKACAVYGYSAEELRRLTAEDLSSGQAPFTAAEARRHIGRARAGEVVRGEWHRRKKDGSLHWDEYTLKRVELAGKPHILAASREITERKAAEEALRASEEQYRAIFNASADSLVLRDADFRIVDVNATYEAAVGVKREQVMGRREVIVGFLGKTEDYLELHRRVLAGARERLEAAGRRPDGSTVYVELLMVPMQYRGAPHVLYIGRDITERKTAEVALRTSVEQYRAIFDATSDGLNLRDAEFRIVDANPAFARMTGYSREEILGTELVTTLSLRDAQFARELHRRALSGEAVRVEGKAMRKDGSLLDCEVHGVPMSYGGKPHVLYIGRDITARKGAEEALRGSEEQYRAIFNASADALVLRDAEFRIVDVNPAYEAMSGKPRAEVIGQTALTVSARDVTEERVRLHAQALAGKPVHFETEGRRPEGAAFVLEVRGVPMSYGGKPHVLYIGRDITEGKLAERALRASEEQYRAIFNATTDALVLRDAEFRIVDVNTAYEAMSGRRREQVIGLRDLTLTRNSAVSAHRPELHREAIAGQPVFFEAEGARPDGTPFVLEVRGVPMSYGGKPHVLYMGRDATEAKLAERALRASEEQYRSIFNAASDSLVLRDAEFRIVDVNPAYEAMSGRARLEVLGSREVTMSDPAVAARIRALHLQAIAGERVQWEARARRKSGEAFDIEVRGVPVRHQGQPHVLYVGRDMTEMKRAEAERAELGEQLRQAQKMEAIGQLTGGVAHDFNNILQGILGNLVLAEERQAELGDERLGRYLERARLASQRARDLIQQMLTFSRGRRGERRPASLAALVREGLKLLRSSLPATLELHTELDEALPAVAADPVQVEQVLMNLCINARDAMDGAGTVAVSVRAAEYGRATCASCRQRIAGRFVELAVRDTGSGIEPQVRDRMFDPFYSTKQVGKGSGMGLAMVHGIVHQHGGHVLVESEPGHGAEFRVLFEWPTGVPAARSPAAEEGARAAPARLAGRVLVADDETIIREFLAEMLEGWGLQVVARADGEEARDAFAEDPQSFDAVLTDQTMPRLTGLQLARLVTRMRPGIPVILCTGYGEDLEPRALKAAGVRTLAKKPIEPKQLRELLVAALQADNKAGNKAPP